MRVAAVYAAGKIGQRLLTKQVAARLAARVESEFIPVVVKSRRAYMIGDGVWQGDWSSLQATTKQREAGNRNGNSQ